MAAHKHAPGAIGTGCKNYAPPGTCRGCNAALRHVLPVGHTATRSWLMANGYDGVALKWYGLSVEWQHKIARDAVPPEGFPFCWRCMDAAGGYDAGEGTEE